MQINIFIVEATKTTAGREFKFTTQQLRKFSE